MIPFIQFTTIAFGPLTFHVWGVMVALGFFTSVIIARAYVRKRGGDPEIMTNLAVWTIIGAASGARFAHVFLYAPDDYLRDPVEIFRVWNGGLSSLGAFIGGPLAAWLYLKTIKLPVTSYQLFSRASIFAFPWGYAIGRIGCFLTHMHPGRLTTSVLGVRYPDGARYDGGLIEVTNGVLMGVVTVLVRRLSRRDDVAVIAGVAWYAIARFFTDFLRSTDLPTSDIRWYGLTPAQFGMILLLVLVVGYELRAARRDWQLKTHNS